MNNAQTDETTPRKPIRLWPGVALVALQWLLWVVVPLVVPDVGIAGLLGAVACGLGVIVWWLFFSRAPWAERVGALAVMALAVIAAKGVVHPSIANAGMGRMIYIFSIPVLCLALVAWAAASRGLARVPRYAALLASAILAFGVFNIVRTGGVRGDGSSQLHWRWTPTPEQRLLAQTASERLPAPPPETTPAVEAPAPVPSPVAGQTPAASPSPAAAVTPEKMAPTAAPAAASRRAQWPGFRGPARDSVIRGVLLQTDWSKTPPVELWRRPVGPGWSSFAVDGDRIYTQEQRGDDEIVASYSLTTGQPVWRHSDRARFWESNGGAGPRATPTLSHGRVYTMGATGILNALDAGTGAVVWSRNAVVDTKAKDPGWGFTASPLVVGDMVIVATSGLLAAYDAASGQPRWTGPTGGAGYSSPHLVTIDGVPQILLLRGSRSTSVSLADGTLLWEHKGDPGVSIVQPAFAADGDILVAAGDAMGGMGIRRLEVTRGPAGWTTTERWNSRGLKPYFNDFVVHEGHAFGFDASILACIDLENGERKWKGGRYGHGQVILLPDQDLLLVLSEEGELALVRAAPDKVTELARFKAIEGKTWNHPVLVGDVVLVRNGEEMAAFRLSLAAADGDEPSQPSRVLVN